MSRKVKRKIKKFCVILLLLVIVIIPIILAYKFFMGDDKVNPETNENNDKQVENNNSNNNNNDNNTNVEDEPKEDSNITKLKQEYYFIDKNLDRYLNYLQNYPEKSMEEVVRCVNSNIDYAFYTNEIPSNLDDGYLLIVNKYHKLDSDYKPELVEMDDKYNHNKGYRYMNPVAYEHFKEMVDAAALDNITLFNVSAYRSYDTQNILYNNYVARDGKEAADTFSARAGYSEHQTGLASDINTSSSSAHFENSKEYAWLIANSYKYGFILRYPKDKEYITGYKYEPWHYRYVGKDVAKYIYENNITYEEYYAFFIENK